GGAGALGGWGGGGRGGRGGPGGRGGAGGTGGASRSGRTRRTDVAGRSRRTGRARRPQGAGDDVGPRGLTRHPRDAIGERTGVLDVVRAATSGRVQGRAVQPGHPSAAPRHGNGERDDRRDRQRPDHFWPRTLAESGSSVPKKTSTRRLTCQHGSLGVVHLGRFSPKGTITIRSASTPASTSALRTESR